MCIFSPQVFSAMESSDTVCDHSAFANQKRGSSIDAPSSREDGVFVGYARIGRKDWVKAQG